MLEITAWHMAYLKAIRLAKAYPYVLAYQYMAAKAQRCLVMAQAQYFAEVQP